MSPEDLVKQGDLGGALALLKARVRSEPGVAAHRVFLFQLLAVMGDWDRARTQLDLAGDLDVSLLLTVNAYRAALEAEAVRTAVFGGLQIPHVLGEPQSWLAYLFEAQRLLAKGEYAAAAEMREQGFDAAPAQPGELNGGRFEWLADADPRLGPCLEVIVEGRYYWVPFANIRELTTEPPGNLRDLVWMPAAIEWTNGGRSPVFIPTRYAGTEKSSDDALRLARMTRWDEPAEGLSLGLGQRLFATDTAEVGLCDVRHLRFDAEEPVEAGEESRG